jgi:hypothetical protein
VTVLSDAHLDGKLAARCRETARHDRVPLGPTVLLLHDGLEAETDERLAPLLQKVESGAVAVDDLAGAVEHDGGTGGVRDQLEGILLLERQQGSRGPFYLFCNCRHVGGRG